MYKRSYVNWYLWNGTVCTNLGKEQGQRNHVKKIETNIGKWQKYILNSLYNLYVRWYMQTQLLFKYELCLHLHLIEYIECWLKRPLKLFITLQNDSQLWQCLKFIPDTFTKQSQTQLPSEYYIKELGGCVLLRNMQASVFEFSKPSTLSCFMSVFDTW